MKAAYIDRFGGPEVLQCGDLPDPSAAAGQVVVDVAEASVNGADWRVRAGQYGQATFPLVLGRDLSGSVAALGAGVGDRRARSRARRRLRREACDQRGDHRQETRPALARRCGAARAHRPLGHHQRRRNELQRGETILIHGGAGGVASFAIRLALGVGALGAVLRWGVMSLNPPLVLLPMLQLLHAFSFGATHLGSMQVLARHAPARQFATAQGDFATALALAMAGGMALSGALYADLGDRAYAAMALAAALGCVFVLSARSWVTESWR